MAAAMNGIAAHGGLIPYGGTFLIFTDYCRPAIRLSALMGARRHLCDDPRFDRARRGRADASAGRASGGVARDPGLYVYPPGRSRSRPPNAGHWRLHRRDAPSLLALTRQALPLLRHDAGAENRSARGAYVLAEADGARQVTLLATGSEVVDRDGGARACSPSDGIARRGRLDAVLGIVRGARPQEYRDAGARRAPRVAVEAAVAIRLGALARRRAAPLSACTASAPRPRARRSIRISASPPKRLPRPPARSYRFDKILRRSER